MQVPVSLAGGWHVRWSLDCLNVLSRISGRGRGFLPFRLLGGAVLGGLGRGLQIRWSNRGRDGFAFGLPGLSVLCGLCGLLLRLLLVGVGASEDRFLSDFHAGIIDDLAHAVDRLVDVGDQLLHLPGLLLDVGRLVPSPDVGGGVDEHVGGVSHGRRHHGRAALHPHFLAGVSPLVARGVEFDVEFLVHGVRPLVQERRVVVLSADDLRLGVLDGDDGIAIGGYRRRYLPCVVGNGLAVLPEDSQLSAKSVLQHDGGAEFRQVLLVFLVLFHSRHLSVSVGEVRYGGLHGECRCDMFRDVAVQFLLRVGDVVLFLHRYGDGVFRGAVEGVPALLVEDDGASPCLVGEDMVDGRFLVHPHGVLPEGLCLFGHHPLHQFLVEFRSHLPHVRLVDVEDDVRDLRPYLVVFLLLLLGQFLVFLRGQRLLPRFVGVDVQRRVEDDDLRLFSFLHVHRLVPFLLRDASLLVHQLLVHFLDLVERRVDGSRVVVGHRRHHEVERVAARVLSAADVLREAVPGVLRARPSHLPVGALDDVRVGHEFVVHVGQRVGFLFAVLSFGVVFLSHGFSCWESVFSVSLDGTAIGSWVPFAVG